MHPTDGLRRRARSLAASAAVLLLAVEAPSARQPRITFTEFHTTTATFAYLKAVADAYPAITELSEIGRSTLGRPIYVLTVSNMKNGVTLDSLVPLRNPREPRVANLAADEVVRGQARALDRREHARQRVHGH